MSADRRQIRGITYTYMEQRPGSPAAFVAYEFRLDIEAGDAVAFGLKADVFSLKKNATEGRPEDRTVHVASGWIWREDETYTSVRVGTQWVNENAVPKKRPGPGSPA